MTADAYRAAIARLGLTQVAAGDWLGSERSSRRWAAEGAPRSVEIALMLAIDKFEAGYSMDQIRLLTTPVAP